FDKDYDGHKLRLKAVGAKLRGHRGKIVSGLLFEDGGKGNEGVVWRVMPANPRAVTVVTEVTTVTEGATEKSQEEAETKSLDLFLTATPESKVSDEKSQLSQLSP